MQSIQDEGGFAAVQQGTAPVKREDVCRGNAGLAGHVLIVLVWGCDSASEGRGRSGGMAVTFNKSRSTKQEKKENKFKSQIDMQSKSHSSGRPAPDGRTPVAGDRLSRASQTVVLRHRPSRQLSSPTCVLAAVGKVGRMGSASNESFSSLLPGAPEVDAATVLSELPSYGGSNHKAPKLTREPVRRLYCSNT